jgi:hypothetical protein
VTPTVAYDSHLYPPIRALAYSANDADSLRYLELLANYLDNTESPGSSENVASTAVPSFTIARGGAAAAD